MKSIGTSDSYQNGNLKIMLYFARFIGQDTDFYQVQKKQQILSFLDTKIKDSQSDPDKKWIRTWNDYLQRIKYFFRWLHNYKVNEDNGLEILSTSDWTTPIFVQIKEKRSKRISPYLETELWERDEIQERIDKLEVANSVHAWRFLLHKVRDMGYSGTDLDAMKFVAESMKKACK